MRIEVKGRNGVTVSEDLRLRIEKRLEKVGRQVPQPAQCDVELSEQRNRSTTEQVAEMTLRLKGTTLRARDTSSNLPQAVNEAADELARQVKRHLDKKRGRRVSGKAQPDAAAG